MCACSLCVFVCVVESAFFPLFFAYLSESVPRVCPSKYWPMRRRAELQQQAPYKNKANALTVNKRKRKKNNIFKYGIQSANVVRKFVPPRILILRKKLNMFLLLKNLFQDYFFRQDRKKCVFFLKQGSFDLFDFKCLQCAFVKTFLSFFLLHLIQTRSRVYRLFYFLRNFCSIIFPTPSADVFAYSKEICFSFFRNTIVQLRFSSYDVI